MKILVTGFKPFLGEKINPSEMLAVELAKNFSEITSLLLPVEFGKSFEILKKRQEYFVLFDVNFYILCPQNHSEKHVH